MPKKANKVDPGSGSNGPKAMYDFFSLMDSYILPSSQGSSTDDNSAALLRALYVSADPDSSIPLAVNAIWNAFGAFLNDNQEQRETAELDFTRAVALTRTALSDPLQTRSCATLVTVLLLSMYEVGHFLFSKSEQPGHRMSETDCTTVRTWRPCNRDDLHRPCITLRSQIYYTVEVA